MLGSDDEDFKSNRTLKFLGIVLVIFVVMTFKSWQELRFRMSGIATQAVVTHITPNHGKYGAPAGHTISYDFTNSNTGRKGHGESIVDEASKFAISQQVDIEYYGDKYPTTRFVGTSNSKWVIAFFVTLTVLVVTIAWLTLKSRREEQEYRERRKGRRG